MPRSPLVVIDTNTGATIREAKSHEDLLAPAQAIMDPTCEEFDAARKIVRPKTVPAPVNPLVARISALESAFNSLRLEFEQLKKSRPTR